VSQLTAQNNGVAIELLDSSRPAANDPTSKQPAAAAADDDDDDDVATNDAEMMANNAGGADARRQQGRDDARVTADSTVDGLSSVCIFTPRCRVLLASALAAVGGVLFGYDIGRPVYTQIQHTTYTCRPAVLDSKEVSKFYFLTLLRFVLSTFT